MMCWFIEMFYQPELIQRMTHEPCYDGNVAVKVTAMATVVLPVKILKSAIFLEQDGHLCLILWVPKKRYMTVTIAG